jgi:hypothetical protein
LIAEAIANIGRLTAEQRDQLSMLLPPPPTLVPVGGDVGDVDAASQGSSAGQGLHHCNRCSIGQR